MSRFKILTPKINHKEIRSTRGKGEENKKEVFYHSKSMQFIQFPRILAS